MPTKLLSTQKGCPYQKSVLIAVLMKYRDMLATVRDRLQNLKSSGKSVEETVAAKLLDDLDPVWGKGLFNSAATSGQVIPWATSSRP